jgi:roadblock/LC7 domain-containing protein
VDEELKSYLDGKFAQVDSRFAQVDARFAAMETRLDGKLAEMETRLDGKLAEMENRLIERTRDMQTELLRGFESFSHGQTVRLRKVEADQSNLDVSLRSRVDVVESRLLQIELRLGKSSAP